jgi:prophage regulatory protein
MHNITFSKLPAVCAATGKSRSTIYEDINRGLFTRPVSLGLRSVAWPQHEVDAINRARMAGAGNDELKALVERLHQERQAGAQGRSEAA